MSAPEKETPFHERFVLKTRLGAGGMGIVYAAHDLERDEMVALKTLHRRNAAALYSFKKEFRTLSDVAHPNLVSLYELIADDERWFFTMELVAGKPFIQHVRQQANAALSPELPMVSMVTETMLMDELPDLPQKTPLSSGAVQPTSERGFDETILRSALKQLAIGIRALHNAGKMHRDLKPHNVLVTPEGRVVILDFGIAREVAPTLSQLTAEAGFLGTLAYMAPEQARGDDTTPASDWYAFGVMLFEALTGHLPFAGTLSQVLHSKLREVAPTPSQLVLGLPTDLVELCNRLLDCEAANRPAGDDIWACLGGEDAPLPDQSYLRLAPVDRELLIGRQTHLATLDKAFLASVAGHALSVHIHGVSGMGKTAIAHTFLRRLIAEARAVVLPGRCYLRELVPYKALDGIVDSLSKYLLSLPQHDIEVLLPREILALARLFPVLRRVQSIADYPRQGRGVIDRLPQRRLAFGALRELLRRIAEHRPVVLYIDDLQWADADSAALLEEILRPPDPPALLLITCFRSEEIASQSFLRDLVSLTDREDSIELSVGPLDNSGAAELARSMLGEQPGLDRLANSIAHEARGNPFLIEQLVGYVKSIDAELAETGLDTQVSLADMLASRIRHCPPGSEPLLSTLATAGQPIDAVAAFQAAGLSGDERPLIAALQAAHLIRPSGSAGVVELYHDRIRETLASQLESKVRQQIHLRVAEALARRKLGDPESLFIHYRSGGDTERAAEQAVQAADRASDALAFDRAALFYRRALDLRTFDPEQSRELRRQLAESHANAGRPFKAAAAFLQLAEGSEGIQAISFRSRAAQEYLASGYFEQGLDELRTVFEALGLSIPQGRFQTTLSMLWQRLRLRLRGLTFDHHNEDQIPPEDLVQIDTCHAAAISLVHIDSTRAASFQTRQLRLALDAGEPLRAARAIGLEASYAATVGLAKHKRVTQLLGQMESLAREVDAPFARGLVHLHAGLTSYSFGRWKKATDHCDEAEVIFTEQCPGAIWEVALVRRTCLSALMQRGELAEVAQYLPGLLAEADERGNVLAAANLRTRLGIHWLAADDVQRCRRETKRALAAWTQQGFHAVHFHAMVASRLADLYEGDGQGALDRLLEAWPVAQRSYLHRIQNARIEGLFLQGRCALAAAATPGTGRRRTLRIVHHAAARIAREKTPYGRPMVELLEGGGAFLAGDRETAIRHLRLAAEGFDTVDMRHFAAAARRRYGELIAGDAGTDRIAKADRWLRQQQIQRPDRMVAMLAPGFEP